MITIDGRRSPDRLDRCRAGKGQECGAVKQDGERDEGSPLSDAYSHGSHKWEEFQTFLRCSASCQGFARGWFTRALR
jgi:hypothetical protein